MLFVLSRLSIFFGVLLPATHSSFSFFFVISLFFLVFLKQAVIRRAFLFNLLPVLIYFVVFIFLFLIFTLLIYGRTFPGRYINYLVVPNTPLLFYFLIFIFVFFFDF